MSLSIPGLSNLPGGLGPIGNPLRPGGARSTELAGSEAEAQNRSQEAAAPRNSAPAADIPPGTDPELWAVLTVEERAHFTRLRSMGPLTYNTSSGHDAPSSNQARRGVRLDIRA